MLCTGELNKCDCGPETLYVHGREAVDGMFLLARVCSIQNGMGIAPPMEHWITRGLIVILRSEWLCKFACEQIVTDKECIGANKLTAYEAVPELTTQVQIREAPPSHCLTMSSGYGVSLQHPDVRYSRAFRVPV